MNKGLPCVLYVGADLSDIFAMYGCDHDGIMRVHDGQWFIRWEDIMTSRVTGNETNTETGLSPGRN